MNETVQTLKNGFFELWLPRDNRFELTILGMNMGFYTTGDVAMTVIISADLGAAIALSVSGFVSAYMSESAEREQELKELEQAVVTDLGGTAHGRAARLIPAASVLHVAAASTQRGPGNVANERRRPRYARISGVAAHRLPVLGQQRGGLRVGFCQALPAPQLASRAFGCRIHHGPVGK